MKSNQTTRVLELLKRFNNGERVCIDRLIEDAKEDAKLFIPNLWLNSENKPVSEKTIRRDFDVIKEYFPDSFELIRGEKGCYKAVTRKAFENFINPEVLSLMVQTFNLANRSDLFENFNLDDSDRKILESKIKETDKLYEFKSKPFETKKDDFVIFKKLESSIRHQKYIKIEYEINDKIEKYEVKPYKIVFINENFYIACEIEHDDLEFAMYRISKIKSIEDTSKTYHKNIEIIDFIEDMQTPFAFYKRDYKKHLITVRVKIDSSKAYFFKSKKHLKYQQVEKKNGDGSLIVSFKITQIREIEDLIKKWIPHIKILEPHSLKEKIEKDLKTYLDL